MKTTKEVIKALLEWRMCSDPFPEGFGEQKIGLVDTFLNDLSVRSGFEDWVAAYHGIDSFGEVMCAVVQEIKPVYVAWSNTDLTEGRGISYPLYVTNTPETAYRLGYRGYVMGSSCPVREALAIKVNGEWYVPGTIMRESEEDKALRIKREKREQSIERAKAAGLSAEDIAALVVVIK